MKHKLIEEWEEEWTEEWPTKKGSYWFYGTCYGDGDPKMHTVEVRSNPNMVWYVVNGHFLKTTEGARGVWAPQSQPKVPDIVVERGGDYNRITSITLRNLSQSDTDK